MNIVQLPARTRPAIWAVGSGKGGVGKSFVASSLGLALARLGRRVVLVDLDLGGANLHTCLGMPQPERGLARYLGNPKGEINAHVVPGPVPGLGLLSAADDPLMPATLQHFQKQKLLRNLSRLKADVVLLDLGAGTSLDTLDFFDAAETGLLVVQPDPTSIENAYRFLKSLFTRRLRHAPRTTRRLMARVLSRQHPEGRKLTTIASFLQAMRQLHPEHGRLLAGELSRQRLHLIVNQALDSSDTELGPAMELAVKQYFGTPVRYAGCLMHDPQVIACLRQRQPFQLAQPHARNAIELARIAETLAASPREARSIGARRKA